MAAPFFLFNFGRYLSILSRASTYLRQSASVRLSPVGTLRKERGTFWKNQCLPVFVAWRDSRSRFIRTMDRDFLVEWCRMRGACCYNVSDNRIGDDSIVRGDVKFYDDEIQSGSRWTSRTASWLHIIRPTFEEFSEDIAVKEREERREKRENTSFLSSIRHVLAIGLYRRIWHIRVGCYVAITGGYLFQSFTSLQHTRVHAVKLFNGVVYSVFRRSCALSQLMAWTLNKRLTGNMLSRRIKLIFY